MSPTPDPSFLEGPDEKLSDQEALEKAGIPAPTPAPPPPPLGLADQREVDERIQKASLLGPKAIMQCLGELVSTGLAASTSVAMTPDGKTEVTVTLPAGQKKSFTFGDADPSGKIRVSVEDGEWEK